MELKIHNLHWEVLFVGPDDKYIMDSVGEGACGLTLNSELKILIVNSLPKDLIWRTIIHELVHAYVWTYGLDGYPMSEESLCNFIETFSESIIETAKAIYNNYYKE